MLFLQFRRIWVLSRLSLLVLLDRGADELHLTIDIKLYLLGIGDVALWDMDFLMHFFIFSELVFQVSQSIF